MLLLPHKKKMATIIVAGLKPKKDYVQAIGEESDTGSFKVPEGEAGPTGLEAAMGSFLSAVEAKDTAAMAEALKEAVSYCQGASSGGEE